MDQLVNDFKEMGYEDVDLEFSGGDLGSGQPQNTEQTSDTPLDALVENQAPLQESAADRSDAPVTGLDIRI